MRVCLMSSDRKLEGVLRSVVEHIPGLEYACASGSQGSVEADIYIRDIEHADSIPAGLPVHEEGRNIFVAAQEDLPELHRRLGTSSVQVALKPVPRAALQSILVHAIGQREARHVNAERDELLECLLLASLKLQRQGAERSNFVARALHDLRAPLTAANGYCGLLLESASGRLDSAQVEMLRRMRHSIERLSKLANSMLQLSLGNTERPQPSLEPADLAACVEQSVYEIAPAAEAGEIEIQVQMEKPSGTLLLDPAQIEQVLVNLLDNACRFTPRRGLIEITGTTVRWPISDFRARSARGESYRPVSHGKGVNAYRLDVCDSGPAIPEGRAEGIFEEFVSYSGSGDRSGTGLGLAICRMIATAHHGHIFAPSCEAGAKFSLVLPFTEPESEDAVAGVAAVEPATLPASGLGHGNK